MYASKLDAIPLFCSAAALAVFAFSIWLGIDFTTALIVLVTGLSVVAVATALSYVGAGARLILPIALVGLWMTLWPALDYRATGARPHAGLTAH